MADVGIENALARADEALDAGRGLAGTGFWKAVDAVRRDPSLAETYADRIGAIDRRAFERGVKLRVPVALGVFGLVVATLVGAGAIVVARDSSGVLAVAAFLIGFGGLIVGTHSLTHFAVGRLLGIRFTHVFLGGPPPPRPGVKTDYASYLRASRGDRAAMHGSGAVVTKIVPFVLIAAAPYTWLVWLMVLVGFGQIATDIFLSTKVSDWKKVKRELSR